MTQKDEVVEADVVEKEVPNVPGVFVARVVDGEGNISYPVIPQDVETDQIQTILEVGLKGFRQQLGL